MPTESTSGLLSNHHLSFDAVKYKTIHAQTIYDSTYQNGDAIKATQPDTIILDTGVLNPGYLTGYYSIRTYWLAPGLELGETAGELEVYQDGVKVDYTGIGDGSVDGKLTCSGVGAAGCGTRFVLYFNSTSTYQIKFKTGTDVSLTDPIILDYIKYDQLHHFNPLMNWVNASEVTGGELWAVDTNMDSVTGDNSTTKTATPLPAHQFKKIYYADATVQENPAITKTAVDPTSTDTDIIFVFTQPSNWTSTLTYRYIMVGTVELPMIQPL